MGSPLLFSEMRLKDVTLRNRIVVPPMLQYMSPDGYPNDWHLMNVGRYAAGGAGLVFVESTKVERRGASTLGDLFLWDDRFTAPISRLAEIIRANGAVPGIQLGHAGRKARGKFPWLGREPLERSEAPDFDEWEPVGPSPLSYGPGWPEARALTLEEIPAAVDAWGQAARRAREAGFDVLEIHAAHGYLIHTFLSPLANQRTDGYGGSEERRHRFALEVIEAVRGEWPEGKPLFMRLSVEDDAGWGPEENIRFCRVAKGLGVDVIDCSSGGIDHRVPNFSRMNQYGFQVPFAAQVKRGAGIATMAVGLIIHGDQAEKILQDGDADLIGVARETIQNPNWAMDAAEKMGVDGYGAAPPQMGWWLAQRAKRGFGTEPSTWRRGLEEGR